MRQKNVMSLALAIAVLGVGGCGGSGGSSKKSSSSTATAPGSTGTGTSGTTPSTSGFEVVDFLKTGPISTPAITVQFSQEVDQTSLVAQKTWLAVEDDDKTSGGNYHVCPGKLELDASLKNGTFTPAQPLKDGQDVRLILTSGVIAKAGGKLTQGQKSEPLSFTQVFVDEVFEGRFLPSGSTTTTTPPATGSTSNGVIPPPTSLPTTAAPGPSVPGAFEIVRTTPSNGAAEPVPTSIFIEFSNPIDPQTLTGGAGGSLRVLQATSQSSTMSFPNFKIKLDKNNTVLEIVPQPLFDAGFDMYVVLSSGLKDTSGNALKAGKATGPLTMKTWIQNQIFELRFTPKKCPWPTNTGDPSIYNLEAGTDPWFFDFDLRTTQLQQDFSSHNLFANDPATDKLCKDWVMAGILETVSLKYGRTADGKGQKGAWKISFTAKKPTGTAGKDYSRMAFGGLPPSSGTLGIANVDAGNKNKDDNSGSGSGIFTAVINGVEAKLNPPLTAADKKFLDGSFKPGQGSAADDERFKKLHAVIDDWSRAVGSVASHETGHSCGLQHLDANLSIMDSASTSSQLAEPRTYFYPQNAAILDTNLGRQ
jgi:hypothetical protein